uniref:N-acyl-aliphatic-L-amino acid amidohydrolase n=1 Tax=Acrobeloides nanus TaxID=290746 RepID=A0A914DJ12_9BILA
MTPTPKAFSTINQVVEDIAVTRFKQYLQIDTEHPDPNYRSCENFLHKYASELGLQPWSCELAPGKPLVGMTLLGENPSLPTLLLYSHTDVVASYKERWTYDPYSGYEDIEGNIYGRGAQDMKSIGIQYLEAIRRLQLANKNKFLRTVHVIFCPDEEISSEEGMVKFVKTNKFKELNIGYCLDEGTASPDDIYLIAYGERASWWVKVICQGAAGHGSRFLENNAGLKLQSILNSFLGYREEQRKRFLNKEGGIQPNVVPAEFQAWFDIRLSPFENFDKFEEMMAGWCKNAGPDVTYEFVSKNRNTPTTPISKEDPWWSAFTSVLDEENLKYSPEIFPGGSDSRFLRELGYKAIGFSPIINTKLRVHDNDEFLNEKVFLNGIHLYTKIIERLANLQPFNE